MAEMQLTRQQYTEFLCVYDELHRKTEIARENYKKHKTPLNEIDYERAIIKENGFYLCAKTLGIEWLLKGR